MTRKQLHELMAGLAGRRPVFHSEADFQHEFAWSVREQNPNAGVRLEYKPFPDDPKGRMSLDLWLSGIGVAVELKYVTRAFRHEIAGESFVLAQHAAQPPRRYHFLDDVQRLERVTREGVASAGWAVFLTNDRGFWTRPKSDTRERIDADFRVHEGRKLTGALDWAEKTSLGTKKGMEHPIELTGSYTCEWRDYGSPLGDKGVQFRYLALRVGR